MKTRRNQTIHSVLRQLTYGLYVVGVCGRPEEANAFVASWVTQCSFDPPLLLAAVSRDSYSHDLLQQGRVFSVNLLARDQDEIARLLVKPSHRVGDKLGKVDYYQEVTGAPILRDALAFLECKLISSSSPGDHLVAIGEVVNAGGKPRGAIMTCADLGWHYAG